MASAADRHDSIGARRDLVVVRTETQLRALEAVPIVADEYGLPQSGLKPCVAFLLDANVGGAGRHDAAFVIAIECRRLELSEAETEKVLVRWSKKIDFVPRQACKAIRSAYAKAPGGGWRYYPPGVGKKPGGRYAEVLGAICADVGCPANCAPFSGLHRGPRGETFERFEHLGWPLVLRKQRHAAAIDYYRAICDLERERGFAAGSMLLTSYRQLGALAGRDARHAGENLRVLYTRGLLTKFERGSGSGPNARDRQPSRLARAVPIPNVPSRYMTAITTDGDAPPWMGGQTPPWVGGEKPPHIGGEPR